MQKFHHTVKLFRQPPPQRDQKYGRFPTEHTYHVDQVPWEPAKRLFESTYEVRGKRRVQIKSPKVRTKLRQTKNLSLMSPKMKLMRMILMKI